MKTLAAYLYVPDSPVFDEYANTFFESLKRHPGNIGPRDWVLAVKDDGETKISLDTQACPIAVGRHGYDIGAFWRLCKEFAPYYDFILMFGAYARILGDGWDNIQGEDGTVPGIFGYHGSFEQQPHIRTSSFGMPPQLMLDLYPEDIFNHPGGKEDTIRFELDAYHRAVGAGYEGYILGRDGKHYSLLDWPMSGTFRSRNQDNELVADRRSDQWRNASHFERKLLTALAWGPLFLDPKE